MLNIILAGVGGQGTVLAAKILAAAAEAKGWRVRTAETIGMAQRGGSVVSHVRLGDKGEEIFAPLVTPGTADVLIAFEPGEAARNLAYLAPEDGVIVTATTTVEPVSAALGSTNYDGDAIIAKLHKLLDARKGQKGRKGQKESSGSRIFAIDDKQILADADTLLKSTDPKAEAQVTRKALNTVMLAATIDTGLLPLTICDLKNAIGTCVRPKFVQMNLAAISSVVR